MSTVAEAFAKADEQERDYRGRFTSSSGKSYRYQRTKSKFGGGYTQTDFTDDDGNDLGGPAVHSFKRNGKTVHRAVNINALSEHKTLSAAARAALDSHEAERDDHHESKAKTEKGNGMTVADAFAKVDDAEGHHHGSDGKFTSGSGGDSAKTEAPEKPKQFESQTCTRCGGAGTYSWNQRDGDRCFGCEGKGRQYTKRGAAAARFYSNSLRVSTSDLKVGDVVILPPSPMGDKGGAFKIEEISKPHVYGTSTRNGVTTDNVGITVRMKSEKPGPEHETNATTTVPVGGAERMWRKRFSPEIMAEKRKAALDYMDTLTAQGVPKKTKKTEKGNGMTVADAFHASFGTVADIFTKSVDVVQPGQYGDKKVAGSMEAFIQTVRDPLIAGCGCPFSGELDETGALTRDHSKNQEQPFHYPQVDATFADKGIVSCSDCGKTWAVPFTLGDGDKDSVVTGEPEERIQAFISPEHLQDDAQNPGDEEVVGGDEGI